MDQKSRALDGLTGFWGVWLIADAVSLDFTGTPEMGSQLVVGALVIFLSTIAFRKDAGWARWVTCGLALLLLFAPLVFHAKSAAAFSSSILLSVLIALSSVVVPSMIAGDGKGEIPGGWSYNPSTWGQRVPIVALALLGFFIARYMAAYQLGYLPSVWDPIFGDGTKRILESDVSKAFPVPDAGLGALSYLVDALFGIAGNQRRWRSMPWLVILFGLLVIPSGATSIVLIMLQPISVGAWCTLCLITATIMLFMVPPAADEVVASVQFLRQAKREGRSFWRVFWKGDETLVPDFGKRHEPVGGRFRWPVSLYVSAALGIWLMFMPAVFGLSEFSRNSTYVVGALAVTASVIAVGEALRPVRYANLLLGLWLMVAPWFLSGDTNGAEWVSAVTGLVLILLTLPRGTIASSFGNYDRIARWSFTSDDDESGSGRAALGRRGAIQGP